MGIACLKEGRNLIIKISGDIDHHATENLKDKIDREFTQNKSKNIIFDFGDVNFMDSSGIGMVIGRYKRIQKQNGKIAVANINGNILRIFEVSGLKKIIECYDTVETAAKNLT